MIRPAGSATKGSSDVPGDSRRLSDGVLSRGRAQHDMTIRVAAFRGIRYGCGVADGVNLRVASHRQSQIDIQSTLGGGESELSNQRIGRHSRAPHQRRAVDRSAVGEGHLGCRRFTNAHSETNLDVTSAQYAKSVSAKVLPQLGHHRGGHIDEDPTDIIWSQGGVERQQVGGEPGHLGRKLSACISRSDHDKRQCCSPPDTVGCRVGDLHTIKHVVPEIQSFCDSLESDPVLGQPRDVQQTGSRSPARAADGHREFALFRRASRGSTQHGCPDPPLSPCRERSLHRPASRTAARRPNEGPQRRPRHRAIAANNGTRQWPTASPAGPVSFAAAAEVVGRQSSRRNQNQLSSLLEWLVCGRPAIVWPTSAQIAFLVRAITGIVLVV